MSSRAASKSLARVRARLSPLGCPRRLLLVGRAWRSLFVEVIRTDLVHLIYCLFNRPIIFRRAQRQGVIGMSGKDPIATATAAIVEAGVLAGAATLVWRGGHVVQTAAVGWRDMEAKLPIERSTLFRIASMTKPITSTAALMLLEEGRYTLDEPIARWAPEFSRMRVLRSLSGPLDQTDPAVRQITFRDLLTHRSGLTYGALHAGPIGKAYAEALGGDIDTDVAPDDWIARLAALPLIDQPGATLHYGHSTDLLGLLIARIEDAPLGDVLARRIFGPLGMKDTGF